MLLGYAETLTGGKTVLTIIVVLVGAIGIMAIGGYALVRILASVVTSVTTGWESSAAPLGLTALPAEGSLYRPLVGERDGYAVKVTHFSVMLGGISLVSSTRDCAQVEVSLKSPVPFPFTISKHEYMYEGGSADPGVAKYDANDEVLDRLFDIQSSDPASLSRLLNVEVPDGKGTTLISDLRHADKTYLRVVLSHRAIALGVLAPFGGDEVIGSLIDNAIELASRVEQAASKA